MVRECTEEMVCHVFHVFKPKYTRVKNNKLFIYYVGADGKIHEKSVCFIREEQRQWLRCLLRRYGHVMQLSEKEVDYAVSEVLMGRPVSEVAKKLCVHEMTLRGALRKRGIRLRALRVAKYEERYDRLVEELERRCFSRALDRLWRKLPKYRSERVGFVVLPPRLFRNGYAGLWLFYRDDLCVRRLVDYLLTGVRWDNICELSRHGSMVFITSAKRHIRGDAEVAEAIIGAIRSRRDAVCEE